MQVAQHAEAILAGQTDIYQHDVHRMAVQLPPEGFGAARPPDLEAAIAQPGQQFIQQIGVIFYYRQP